MTNGAKEKYFTSILGSSVAWFWSTTCNENWIYTAVGFKIIINNKRLLTKPVASKYYLMLLLFQSTVCLTLNFKKAVLERG